MAFFLSKDVINYCYHAMGGHVAVRGVIQDCKRICPSVLNCRYLRELNEAKFLEKVH